MQQTRREGNKMPFADGIVTFMAGEDLEAHRRVKIDTSGTQSPIDVVYAGAGEAAIGVTEHAASDTYPVAVKLFTWGGTMEIEAADTWSVGATIYGAADGKASDTSSGSAIGVAKEACATAGEIHEIVTSPVLSSTAATVSIADSGTFTDAATVEAALAEIYQDLLSAQCFIPVPLTSWMLGNGTNTVSFGGPATDPVLDMTNGDTDSALRFTWAAASVVPIITQIPLPPDLDVTADLVLHLRTSKSADANTVTLASDSYFNEGDTKVEDVTATIAAAAGETTITIAAADVPAGAQSLTIELTPSAHASDSLYLYASWLEYTRSIRTS